MSAVPATGGTRVWEPGRNLLSWHGHRVLIGCWRGIERLTIERVDGRHALDGGVKERRGLVAGASLAGARVDCRVQALARPAQAMPV